MGVFVLIAFYADGSGKPEVLRVYKTKTEADMDKEMIEATFPSKELIVRESWLDEV